PVDVVRWFGAVQAQDFNGAKWALALRMREATNAVIQNAYDEGQIVRTHIMRPTWHFVAREDIRWLLQLTAPRVNIKSGSGYRMFELDAATFKRSNKVIANALKDSKHLMRSAIKTLLNRAGVNADNPVRLAHIVLRAELDGVVCSGPMDGKQFTYMLFDERVPATKTLSRQEALAELARRYFKSHGPATVQDFVWWSGLTMADANHGIQLIDKDLRKEMVDDKLYVGLRLRRGAMPSRCSAHLLPAFDEYNVAYKARHLVIDGAATLSTWNALGPMIIADGKAVGAWKRTGNVLTLTMSNGLKKSHKLAIAAAAERYTAFLGVSLQILYGVLVQR
ncbi:MAG TPA: winged helix DNA-binding domain-containing protein, partial [Pyrinomonadaceae bacterium]|nr:winged helix DNA-binding domain-containing protein [Pyrinomonadaceae bacterium]